MNILFVNALIGILILILLLGITLGLILPACSVKSVFGMTIGNCTVHGNNQSSNLYLESKIDRNRLIERINQLESQLQGQICESPLDQSADSKIDIEAWNKGDISELEGCWELGRNQMVVTDWRGNISKRISKFTLCMDQNGNG